MKNLQILIFLFSSVPCFGEGVSYIISQSAQAEFKGQQMAKGLLDTLDTTSEPTNTPSFFFEEVKPTKTSSCNQLEGRLKNLAPVTNLPTAINNKEELLVFVSFSLPESVLKSLHQQSQQNNGRLIFRGLVNDSFKETQKAFLNTGIEGYIDPILFEKHTIQQVPTFVLVTKTGSDRVAGNISVSEALKIMGEGAPNG